jgi:hypothetical protein
MVNIAQALGSPVVFIRYNPDVFKDDRNLTQDPSHAQRMRTLGKCIETYKNIQTHELSGFVTERRLFFNGWTPKHTSEHATIVLGFNE